MTTIAESKWTGVFLLEEDIDPEAWPEEHAEQENIKRLLNAIEVAPLLETPCLKLIVAILEEVASRQPSVLEDLVYLMTGECAEVA